MNIIKSSVALEFITPNALQLIEKAGRTCYKSENKITKDSSENFCKMIQTRNHMSVLEHASATFRIICDRGVSHEIVRHRIAAYSMESTRYCNYGSDKKGMQFILPTWANSSLIGEYNYNTPLPYASNTPENIFLTSCINAEILYNQLLKLGQTPQQARAILPHSLKTELVMTANFREWLHFLELRTSQQAHPDMKIIANMIKDVLMKEYPIIFGEK